MAVTRPGGASGGAGGKSNAVTRLDVVDPHILIMMRDVMDSAETAVRLNTGAGSGGGGGGGSASVGSAALNNATAGATPSTVNNAINTNNGANGGTGNTGAYTGSPSFITEGGGGGGGGGGNGGALIIISTTAAASMGTCQVNGGSAGSDGANGTDGASAPQAGNSGKLIQIQV